MSRLTNFKYLTFLQLPLIGSLICWCNQQLRIYQLVVQLYAFYCQIGRANKLIRVVCWKLEKNVIELRMSLSNIIPCHRHIQLDL